MVSRGKSEQQAARNARLAAALRENLKRRKAHARGRTGSQEISQASDQEARRGSEGTSPATTGPAVGKTPDFRRNRERD